MRTATSQVAAITITCPYCGEVLSDPRTGSTLLTHETQLATTVTCRSCVKVFRVPAAFWRLVAL